MESEDLEFLLALEKGDVGELERVEVEAVDVGLTLTGTTVTYPHVGDLGELGEDYVTIFLDFF